MIFFSGKKWFTFQLFPILMVCDFRRVDLFSRRVCCLDTQLRNDLFQLNQHTRQHITGLGKSAGNLITDLAFILFNVNCSLFHSFSAGFLVRGQALSTENRPRPGYDKIQFFCKKFFFQSPFKLFLVDFSQFQTLTNF